MALGRGDLRGSEEEDADPETLWKLKTDADISDCGWFDRVRP